MPDPVSAQERRATANLLWQACHRHPDPRSVKAALSGAVDATWVVQVAVRQRIGPLLWRALELAGELDWLGESRETLGSIVQLHKMEAHLLFPRAVATALGPLNEGGLEPVILKGPALATRYPAPGLRPMGDVDLLLPPAEHPKALALLAEAGWRVVRRAAKDHYDTVLLHDEIPSLVLELHYGLEASWERFTSLDPIELWELRQPVECLGTPAFGLPLEAEIVVLAAHAGKPYHGFSQLVWIADLASIGA